MKHIKTVRQEQTIEEIKDGKLTLSSEAISETFDPSLIENRLHLLSFQLSNINLPQICESAIKQVYKGITKDDLNKIVLNSIRERIEQHTDYSFLSSRYALDLLSKRVLDRHVTDADYQDQYRTQF